MIHDGSFSSDEKLDMLFSLLGRYILHVEDLEGVDFINDESTVKIDSAEKMALRLAKAEAFKVMEVAKQ